MATSKMTSCLWFDNQAKEAAEYYTSIFKDASIGRTAYYGKEGHDIHGKQEGSVLTVEFTLNGQSFIALNGGPVFNFNEAVSFVVNCDSQEEIDYYWDKLKEGGDPKAQQCGWLKDKFGLSWQINASRLDEMLTNPDKEKTERVMKVMLQMKKLNITELEAAYKG